MNFKILIACECSGRVRQAFRDLGYEAWSNDIKDAEDGSRYHIKDDALKVIADGGWDLVVGHPVCKFLANSGSKHLYIDMKKENGIYQPRWDGMEEGAKFYANIWDADAEYVAVENPIWHRAATDAVHRHCQKPHPVKRQFVQPWWFGHMEVKATGLAFRNLPPLVMTNNVKEETMALDYGKRAKVHHMAPGPEREADRSRTLQGLAYAIASQWGLHMERDRWRKFRGLDIAA